MLRRLPNIMLAIVFLLVGSAAYAQEGTIRGTLTDSTTSESLPGASVLVKELGVGASANAQGEYVIENVPAGTYNIRASFVGYETKDLEVSIEAGENTVNFQLVPSTYGLKDVVVTAFGIEREQRSVGYAAQSVNTEDMTRNRESNFINSLQGKIAGVSINRSSSSVGSSSSIVLRGASSLTGNNQPLFIVDGVYIDNSNFDAPDEFSGEPDYGNAAMDINPEDIKSINVLKGANAAALYGSRASNGAIVITTKDGAAQEGMQVDFSENVTFTQVSKLPDLQNEYGQGSSGQFSFVKGQSVDESWGPKLDTGAEYVQWWSNGQPVPWESHPDNVRNYFETGVKANTNLAIAGNYQNSNFRLSITDLRDQGILPNSSLNRNNISLNAGAQLTDKFSANGRIQYIRQEGANYPSVGYSSENPMQSLTQWFGRQVDMERLEDYETDDGEPRTWNYQYHDNPYWMQYKNTTHQTRDRVIGNISVTYDFTNWLRFTGKAGRDYYQEQRDDRRAVNTINDPDGYYEESTRFVDQQTYRAILNAQKDLNQQISLDARIGAERFHREYSLYEGVAPALSVPGVYNLQNSSVRQQITDTDTKKRINSVFGTATIGYRDFIYLDVGGRNDWSSTLPADNNSYFYPNAGLSFIFTDALDLGLDWFSFGKLRASWAQSGNDTDPYSLLPSLTAVEPFGDTPMYTVENDLPNPELKPESKTSVEIGTDLRFMKNRFGLDVTYYNETTEDQILPAQISRSAGFDSRILNAGEVKNTGVEVTFNATPVQQRDFQWDVTVNWAKNQNEVVSLAEDLETLVHEATWDVTIESRPGEEAFSLYGVGFKRVESGDHKGKIVVGPGGIPQTSGEVKNWGNFRGDWTGSFQSTFNYKNVSLSFLIDTKQGGKISSVTYMFGRYTGILEETLKGREQDFVFDGGRWADGAVKQTGTDANGNPVYAENDIGVSAQTFNKSSFFGNAESHIFDASYVKLRELRITYRVPNSALSSLPVKNVELSAVGNNLWIIDDNVPHIDAEASFSNQTFLQGLESNQLPATRSFGFNVKLSI